MLEEAPQKAMNMRRILLSALFMLSVAADNAQDSFFPEPILTGHPLVCNTTIDRSNASGVFTFPVQYQNATQILNNQPGAPVQNVPDPSWAVTVAEANDVTETTLWYDTAGQNYSDDFALGYDVCAYAFTKLPLNTIELGQDDPGDCSTMLSWNCRQALMTSASNTAYHATLYRSPSPNSNLSAFDLPQICLQIYTNIGYLKECAQDLGLTKDATGDTGVPEMLLTGNGSSVLDSSCTLQDQDKTLHNVIVKQSNAQNAYDNSTRSVWPILSVFFPVANGDYQGPIQTFANSTLTCVRAKNFSEGSRVSPKLPSGTPYSNDALSGGDIAGIVVGVVAFVAIVVGLGVYFWKRKRAGRARQVNGKSLSERESGATKETENIESR